MVSLRELSADELGELVNLHTHVADRLRAFGGTVFAFEHGSSAIGSVAGCGVDQAHLHLVPLGFNLVEWALAHNDDISWVKSATAPLVNLPDEGEYVSVWEVGRTDGAVGNIRQPVSQWMRRLIACRLGIETQWNYRTNPHLENVQRTIQNFAT